MKRSDPTLRLDDTLRLAKWLHDGHLPQRKGDITVLALAELLRRDQETNQVDGYPASSTGGGSHGGDISRPTESAAQRSVDDDLAARRDRADQVHRAVHGIDEHLRRAVDHLTSAVSLSYLVHRLSQPRKVNEPTPCRACDRLITCANGDHPRRGYCSACDTAYRRYSEEQRAAGREPDRPTFERNRRGETAA